MNVGTHQLRAAPAAVLPSTSVATSPLRPRASPYIVRAALELAIGITGTLTGWDRGEVWTRTAGDSLRLISVWSARQGTGPAAPTGAGRVLADEVGLPETVRQRGRTVWIDRVALGEGRDDARDPTAGPGAALGVPVIVGETLEGVLVLVRRRPLAEQAPIVALATTVAAQAAQKIAQCPPPRLNAGRPGAVRDPYRQTFLSSPIGTAIATPSGRLATVNHALCDLLGRSAPELTKVRWSALAHAEDLVAVTEAVRRLLAGDLTSYQGECRVRHADGRWLWTLLHVSVLRREDGTPYRLLGQVQDITERRRTEAALAHRALHDPLTDLPNRALLLDRLKNALAHADRVPGSVALLFIDLDRFKQVNDRLGHDVGDALLVQVAERLLQAIRAADTAARLGGDEFVVLCAEVAGEAEARVIAGRVAQGFARPFRVGHRHVRLTASVGIGIATGRDTRPEDLLSRADAAMYRAKTRARAEFELTEARDRSTAPSPARPWDGRGIAGRDERRATPRPPVHPGGGTLRTGETLARWQHPT